MTIGDKTYSSLLEACEGLTEGTKGCSLSIKASEKEKVRFN